MPRLTEENQHLQKTVARLTSQLDETEKRLEQERNTRQSLEESREAKVRDIESSWSAVLKEKKDNWEAKERSLEEKVENQDRLLREIKASYEVSQRLNRGEEADSETGRSGATAAELEIVTSELDRANMRLAEVEGRNEQLRLELAQSASHAQSTTKVEDDPAFLRLQSENSSLLRRLEAARFEKDSEKRRWEADLRSLEREIATLKSDRDALRDKVQRWGDYEDVKRELEILKVCALFAPARKHLLTGKFSPLSSQRVMTMMLRAPKVPLHLTRCHSRTDRQGRARAKHSNSYCSRVTRSSAMN